MPCTNCSGHGRRRQICRTTCQGGAMIHHRVILCILGKECDACGRNGATTAAVATYSLSACEYDRLPRSLRVSKGFRVSSHPFLLSFHIDLVIFKHQTGTWDSVIDLDLRSGWARTWVSIVIILFQYYKGGHAQHKGKGWSPKGLRTLCSWEEGFKVGFTKVWIRIRTDYCFNPYMS